MKSPGGVGTDDSENGRGTLAAKVAGGAAWLFGSYALSKLGRVGMMLVIAVLLSPREYGLIGLSAVLVTTAQAINEFGIWQAVVNRKDPDGRFLDTAFAANAVGGVLTSAGVFLAAPWVAQLYGEPGMTGVLRVMGLALVFDGLFYVPDGLLRKDLRFKSRALPEIAGTLAAAVVTVALVLLGFGVLGYAVGFAVEGAARCVLTFRQIGWRPRVRFSRPYLGEIASYARHIVGADLARHVSSNMDYFIIGFVLGAGPLGYYTLAFNLANYPVSNFAQILSRLAFPTFATLQENPEQAKRAYLKMVGIVAALAAPALGMLALLAALLVDAFLGADWRPAILVLQIMVVAGISRTISFPGSDMLRAIGFQSVPFKINVIEGLVVLGALLLIAPRGIEATALAMTVILSSASWVTTLATCRAFGIGFWQLVRAFVPGVILTAGGAGAVLSLRLLGVGALPDVLEVGVLVIAAGLAIAVCLATVCRSFSKEIFALVAPKKSG